MLLSLPAFRSEPAKSWVLPLHSAVPPEDQRKCFQKPPPGARKVVLATNM
jgi:HrpA-like RNA helicase